MGRLSEVTNRTIRKIVKQAIEEKQPAGTF